MLSKQHQFVFVHVPKTGGASVVEILRALYQEKKPPCAHLTASEYRRMLGHSQFDAYYKWAIVRNPYERFLSSYYWRKHQMLRRGFRKAAAVSIEDLALNMERYRYSDERHILSQYELTHVDGKCVCEIYRYEEGLENILRLAIPKISQDRIPNEISQIPRIHDVRRDKRPYYEQLSPAAIEAISQRYRKDFEAFGYEFHKHTNLPKFSPSNMPHQPNRPHHSRTLRHSREGGNPDGQF